MLVNKLFAKALRRITTCLSVNNSLRQKLVSSASIMYDGEAVVQRCSVKKVFLEISQNSQENTCARVSFFNKVAGLRPATLLKRDSGTGVFL